MRRVLFGPAASLFQRFYTHRVARPLEALSLPGRWLRLYREVQGKARDATEMQERIEKAYLDFRLVVAARMIFYLPPGMVEEVERLRAETGPRLEPFHTDLRMSPAILWAGIAPLHEKLSDIEELLEKQTRLLKLLVRMPKSAGYLHHKKQIQLERKRQKEVKRKEEERAAQERGMLERYKARLGKAIHDAAILGQRGLPINGDSRFLKTEDARNFWIGEMGKIEVAETRGLPAEELVQAVDRLSEIIAAYGYKAQQVKATEDELLELIGLHARLRPYGKTAFTAQALEPVLVTLQVTVPGHWSRGEWEEMEKGLLDIESFVRERRPVIRRELFLSEHPTRPFARPAGPPISPKAVTKPLRPPETEALESLERKFAGKWIPVRTKTGFVIEVDESLIHLYQTKEEGDAKDKEQPSGDSGS